MKYGFRSLCAAALAASIAQAGDSFLALNEIYISHDGTDDMEYVELIGSGGQPLDGYLVCVVEGDGSGAGTLDRAYDLTGQTMPMDGYFVLGDTAEPATDLDIGASNTLENGTNTFYLVFTNDVSAVTALLGTDVDSDDDLVTDLTTVAFIVDSVGVADGGFGGAGTDMIFDGATVVGPDGSFGPAGIFRDGDHPGAWCNTDFLDFDDVANTDLPRTPGALNIACPPAMCGADDALEDNDDCMTAAMIGAGTLSALQAVDADADFFRFTVAPGEIVTASASFTHVDADVDMRLFDADCMNELDASGSVSDMESVAWSNDTGMAADVTIEVFVFNGGPGCSFYDLDVSTEVDPCLAAGDDALEDNDDCASASPLGAGTTAGLFVRKGDEDWHSVSVPAFSTAYIQAIFEQATADVDMRLRDDCAGGSVDISLSISDNEQVAYVNATAAAIDVFAMVEVFSGSAGDCTPYDVVVSFESGMPGTNFCAATPNSSGFPANVSASGSSSVSANDLTLVASPVPANVPGVFFHGPQQASIPFQGGMKTQCTNMPVRGPIAFASGTTLASALDNASPANIGVIFQSTTRYFQAWFRDNADVEGYGLSNGYAVTFTE